MGNEVSVSLSGPNSKKKVSDSYLYCRNCEEWVGGSYVLGKVYPCFNAPACSQTLRPLDYPPSPHYYHCLCGNIDVRENYMPLVLGCSRCGDLVKPTLEPPKRHYFLCPCSNFWDKICYGNETEPCLACGFEVVPRSSPPTLWYFWCMCGEKRSQLSYNQPTLDCPGRHCRENIVGMSDPPETMYYKCKACSVYFKDYGYKNVPQPCTECPAKIWPSHAPEFQHYLCPKCWMYFGIRSDPNETLRCRRQDCNTLITPTIDRPESIYLREGQFVAPVPQNDFAPKTPCFFLCNCGALNGDYWWEQSWNPTEPQYCERCKFDVYPFSKPLANRQHVGYFVCRCGVKWRSERTYPGVNQSCRSCSESVAAVRIEPKSTRGVVV